MGTEEQVILVDSTDKQIGVCEKMEAHEKGLLHRAFSVFIFNSKGQFLLQQRALHKYHSGGLWTNTCCSHPRPEETSLQAAQRRLVEEMGMDCEIQFAFIFLYKAHLDKQLIEHELDHVFIGFSDEHPKLNIAEAADYTYISTEQLKQDLSQSPKKYTAWFKLCLDQVLEHQSRIK